MSGLTRGDQAGEQRRTVSPGPEISPLISARIHSGTCSQLKNPLRGTVGTQKQEASLRERVENGPLFKSRHGPRTWGRKDIQAAGLSWQESGQPHSATESCISEWTGGGGCLWGLMLTFSLSTRFPKRGEAGSPNSLSRSLQDGARINVAERGSLAAKSTSLISRGSQPGPCKPLCAFDLHLVAAS